jgi:tetrahydromethanopterin S-methyltransferase subunit B
MEVDMDMEQRVDKLEIFADDTKQRLARIETRLDETATKADLYALETRLVKWFVGTAIALSAGVSTIVFAIAKLIH